MQNNSDHLAGGAGGGVQAPLTDAQINHLWLSRDCMEAIQDGDIFAQVRCVVRAAIAKAQGGAA